MKDGFIWTDDLTDLVVRKLMLSGKEETILRTRVRGYPISYQAEITGYSESTVNRTIADLKKRYDELQRQYPDDFPVRKASKTEKFMDEN